MITLFGSITGAYELKTPTRRERLHLNVHVDSLPVTQLSEEGERSGALRIRNEEI